jgi:hypothetical protein
MFAAAGGPAPPPELVHVTNSGTGNLTGLAAAVQYSGGGPQWLQAMPSGTTAPMSFTLTAVTAGLAAGVRTATLSITSTLTDVAAVQIPVTLTLTGFAVTPTANATVVSEAGLIDTLMVVLETRPREAVVLSVSGDPTEVATSPSTISFEPEAWNVPQPITVFGVDDFIDDGDQVTRLTIAVVAAASDDTYASVPPKTVDVTTIDDDEPPGLIISETGDTRVSESGSTDTFTVRLTARPGTDVVLTVTSADRGEVTVTPSTLIFGTSNWNQPQTVTVRGIDDFADDGDQVTGVTITVLAVVSDDAFDAVPPRIVTVTTTDDDDPPGLAVEETGGSTRVNESGTTDTFTVRLTAQPGTDVVLTVTSGDTGEVIVTPATLTFTSGNWDEPQTVVVRGVNDVFDDGDQVTTVTIAVIPVVSDDAYDSVPPRTVSVTTVDND